MSLNNEGFSTDCSHHFNVVTPLSGCNRHYAITVVINIRYCQYWLHRVSLVRSHHRNVENTASSQFPLHTLSLNNGVFSTTNKYNGRHSEIFSPELARTEKYRQISLRVFYYFVGTSSRHHSQINTSALTQCHGIYHQPEMPSLISIMFSSRYIYHFPEWLRGFLSWLLLSRGHRLPSAHALDTSIIFSRFNIIWYFQDTNNCVRQEDYHHFRQSVGFFSFDISSRPSFQKLSFI
jgi:hypothetical protein